MTRRAPGPFTAALAILTLAGLTVGCGTGFDTPSDADAADAADATGASDAVDAEPLDAEDGASDDTGGDTGGDVDPTDGGADAGDDVDPDADPSDADPSDADPPDADPSDADPSDAGPADTDPADAGPDASDAADADPADATDTDPADATDVFDRSCDERPGRSPAVRVVGRQLLVGDAPVHFKGVAWAPVPRGRGPGDVDFAGAVEADAALMEAAGIDLVRTYGPILDRDVLDTLHASGIAVWMTVYYGYGDTPESAVETVCALKDHPAIIGWIVGNEWNLNLLGRPVDLDTATEQVGSAVDAIAAVDASRPVMTVWGGMPPVERIERLAGVDVWGLNVYPGRTFGDLFTTWAERSDAPVFIAEYGADAFDGREDRVDEATQAGFVEDLTREIYASSALRRDGVCVGGAVFEFNDEWWKYDGGAWDVHDRVASWDNGGYPDPGMHEEWWGLVDIDRVPREAYRRYAALPAPRVGDPEPTTATVRLCVDTAGGPVPSEAHPSVVANGSWSDWAGWGVELTDADGDGRFCGTLEELAPGAWEFQFAGTGPGDDWSGWGLASGPPRGSACDWNPDDAFANYGFRVAAGETLEVCHAWGACGCR